MSGKASEDTIARLTANMVTSLTTKTLEDSTEPYLLVLVSTTSGSRKQLSQQERSIAMMEALELPFELLNCALPENRDRRNGLFEISGIRGNYPQFFKISGTPPKEATNNSDDAQNDQEPPKPEFVGSYEDIEGINENSNVDAKELKEDDLTWDRLMGTTNKYDKRARNVNVDLGAASAHSRDSAGSGGIYGALDDSDKPDDEDDDGLGGNLYADL